MKLILITLALLGAVLATPTSKSLQDDLNDFRALIPVEKFKKIICSYKNDAEVQFILKYLKGDKVTGLVADLREKEAWISFKNYLSDAGLNIEAILDYVHNLIAKGVCDDNTDSGKTSLKNLLAELKSICPKDDFKILFQEKLKISPAFQEFYAKISSEESRELLEKVVTLDEFQQLTVDLEFMGFDLQGIRNFIYGILGWK